MAYHEEVPEWGEYGRNSSNFDVGAWAGHYPVGGIHPYLVKVFDDKLSPVTIDIRAGLNGQIRFNLTVFGTVWEEGFGTSMPKPFNFDRTFIFDCECTPEGELNLHYPAAQRTKITGPVDVAITYQTFLDEKKPSKFFIRFFVSLSRSQQDNGSFSFSWQGVGVSVPSPKAAGAVLQLDPLEIDLNVIAATKPVPPQKPAPPRRAVAPTILHPVYFNIDSADIDQWVVEPDGKRRNQGAEFAQWLRALKDNPQYGKAITKGLVSIHGEARASATIKKNDAREMTKHNQNLSDRRKEAVLRRLTSFFPQLKNPQKDFVTSVGMVYGKPGEEVVDQRVCWLWIEGDELARALQQLKVQP